MKFICFGYILIFNQPAVKPVTSSKPTEELKNETLNKSTAKKGFLRDRIVKTREAEEIDLESNEIEKPDEQPNELSTGGRRFERFVTVILPLYLWLSMPTFYFYRICSLPRVIRPHR